MVYLISSSTHIHISFVLDDNVFLLDPLHPEAHDSYANKINALLENATLRNAFSIAARKKIISKFSSEIVAKQSVEFYQKKI